MAEEEEVKEEEEEEEIAIPGFKISYFPFAGRAFSLRLAGYIGGVSYTDEFITKQEHEITKKSGNRRWNGLPELTIYNKENKELIRIGQSNNCLRYIGLISGLYPGDINPILGALCDEILDSVEDTSNTIKNVGMTTKEQRLELISKNGKLTYWLTKFEKRFNENIERGNKNGYIVGDKLTIADLKLFELFHSLFLIFTSYEDIPKDYITKFPNIQKHYQLIKENENVEEFLQKFSLRNSEFKLDPNDQDIKIQTFKGKTVYGSL